MNKKFRKILYKTSNSQISLIKPNMSSINSDGINEQNENVGSDTYVIEKKIKINKINIDKDISQKQTNNEMIISINSELTSLNKLKGCPNIPQLIDYKNINKSDTDTHIFILKYATGGDMLEYINKHHFTITIDVAKF